LGKWDFGLPLTAISAAILTNAAAIVVYVESAPVAQLAPLGVTTMSFPGHFAGSAIMLSVSKTP
jgi:hypothetical protein